MSSNRSLRLLIVTGTRADFGLWRAVISEAERRPSEVGVRLLVSGMHLDDRFGGTIAEIRASGTPIAAEIPFTAPGDSRVEMAASLGQALTAFAPAIDAEAPDWLLLLGDRGEQLAAALVGVHLGLPIAHLHGGERSLGAVDDTLRDMISRAAHLHLVATTDAADRLARMGEASWRIHVVGAPGLDAIAATAPAGPEGRRAVGLPADGPYALLVQHPETVGGRDGVVDLDASLEAISAIDLPVLAVAPNADAGGRAMFERLRAAGVSALHASLSRDDFLALLAGASVLIGNSSSGLIEAPLLGVPAVNVGDRQRGRTRGDNVIDAPADREQIVAALRRAIDPSFRASLSRRSPYGDGHSAPRILDAIVAQPIDERLLVKEVAP
jgi:GDP/UDP-N,N'-diacetylbacillosamine 2-epimerase (hydrolysing)